jgi:hypothetical protein
MGWPETMKDERLAEERATNAIDRRLGQRVRTRRLEIGTS